MEKHVLQTTWTLLLWTQLIGCGMSAALLGEGGRYDRESRDWTPPAAESCQIISQLRGLHTEWTLTGGARSSAEQNNNRRAAAAVCSVFTVPPPWGTRRNSWWVLRWWCMFLRSFSVCFLRSCQKESDHACLLRTSHHRWPDGFKKQCFLGLNGAYRELECASIPAIMVYALLEPAGLQVDLWGHLHTRCEVPLICTLK